MGDLGAQLHAAVDSGDEAAVRALLDEGLRPDEWRDWQGWTALHLAANCDHAGVTRALVKAGADIEARGEKALSTPLHIAAASCAGDGKALRVLIDAGADVRAKNRDGDTPLHCAARAAFRPEAVKYLILAGADASDKDVDGRTALAWACRFRHRGLFASACVDTAELHWSCALHPKLPRPSREVVLRLMLCQERVATGALCPGLRRSSRRSEAQAALPALPVDVLLMILGFVRAADLAPRVDVKNRSVFVRKPLPPWHACAE